MLIGTFVKRVFCLANCIGHVGNNRNICMASTCKRKQRCGLHLNGQCSQGGILFQLLSGFAIGSIGCPDKTT